NTTNPVGRKGSCADEIFPRHRPHRISRINVTSLPNSGQTRRSDGSSDQETEHAPTGSATAAMPQGSSPQHQSPACGDDGAASARRWSPWHIGEGRTSLLLSLVHVQNRTQPAMARLLKS